MSNFYYVGGSVPLDSPSYIKRETDELFYNYLKSGRYCYVLNSRQMGKSSLWVQTQRRLTEEGIRCTTIDLSGIGKDSSEDVWYQVLFRQLVTNFELSITNNRQTWWNERADVSAINRLDEFIEEILLKEVEQPIVICLDEIDSVLSLNFSIDDFFAWMRSCHEKRPHHPIYQRLTFCMLGVATVSDFMRDNARSPFNIGQDIPLSGFTKGEAGQLVSGLQGKVPDPRRVLEEVLEWTGGQPFLTQKICNLIYTSRTSFGSESSETPINVSDFVQSKIINNWESQDSPVHLGTIRRRLLNTPSIARSMLLLYQEILDKGEIIDRSSPDQIQLRLTGLVVQQNQKLKVYNKIYRYVFNETWVKRELSKIPLYIEKYQIWLNSGEDATKLLSGQALQEALTWSKDKSLNDAESRFLGLSQIEEERKAQIARQQEAYQLSQKILSPEFSNDDKRTILIDEILDWTGNQLDLVEIVCDLLIENKDKLIAGEESTEGLIQKHIIKNWQQNRASSHLQKMQNYLLGEGNIQARLRTYQDILQGRVFADDKLEKLSLQQAELVVKNEDYLEVTNRIYRAVFNLQWVNQELEKLADLDKQPAPTTTILSMILLIIFVVGGFGLVILKPKNPPDKVIPQAQIPEICIQRNIHNALKDDIQQLQALESQQGNYFPQQCKTQLTELKLIQDAIGLAGNGYIVKAPQNQTKNTDGAFLQLCKIPAKSRNIEEAKFWANRWYNQTWKAVIDKALRDKPECEHLKSQ